jgi:DNA-binding PadR family transcriptional regulator
MNYRHRNPDMFEHTRHQGPSRHHHRAPRHDSRHDADSLPAPIRRLLGRGQPGGAVRRGEVRLLILAALAGRPMHGYEVIQELEALSGGRWRPSAGSVYPTLQQLADEGLVTGEDVEGRRTYTLTDTGRAAAQAAPPRPDWSAEQGRDADLRHAVLDLVKATMQVAAVGTPRARRETEQILTDARRRLYQLLADDEPAEGDEPEASPSV